MVYMILMICSSLPTLPPQKKTWKFTIEANRQMSPQGGKLGEMVQGEGPVPLST